MTTFNRGAGSRAVLLGATLAAGLTLAPTGASAGFLDQLFGGGALPSQPSFNFEPRQPTPDEFNYSPIKRRPRAKAVVALHDQTPERQKTTDLWHDKTLRPGDAIMMKDGMHVFKGGSSALHLAKDFVPVDRARQVASKERIALLALDTTRNDPLQKGHAPDTLASGRSAAVATPITEGIRITDARGASIRYVGP